MSRTERKRKTYPKGKKLKPYAKKGSPKYYAPSYEEIRKNGNYGQPTKEMKLEVRNANRSLKKGKRQQLLQQLRHELSNL